MSNLMLLRKRLHARCLSTTFNQVRRYALIGKPIQDHIPVWSLPKSPARTRFAPSPTGYLHLGSLRTALYNYLLAQATGGQFIIRLEDTDQARFVQDSEARLYQDLQWAGLSWDEGPDKGGPYGPYRQSDRLNLYRRHVDMLLEKGQAFRCFCSKEVLEFNLQQATASGATAHYPGTCKGISRSESERRAANGEPHTVRFKASEVPVSAPDLVYGAYKKSEPEDNFIIMKSDGFPTYHFANVVDDHFMAITHVIRGAEWLISTPKHVELYNAFGWQPPNFAHVGLLVDHQRQKLSKRDMDNIGISAFKDNDILPEALLNFAALLGWDPSLQNRPHLDKRGRMTLEEMKEIFTLKFTRGDIVVDLSKLKFFQNRFKIDLISGEIADPDTLRRRILKPILSELERLQLELSEDRVSEAVADVFGNNPSLVIAKVHRPGEFTEEYIHRVLKAWKGPMDNHRQVIRDNLFAFWAPSRETYRQTLRKLQAGMRNIKLTRQKSKRKILNVDLSKVILYFKNDLDELSDENWTLETVGAKAKELADMVTYYDIEKGHAMDSGAGWKFLRWGLLGGQSGVSIVPVMMLLGKTEVIKRLKRARKVTADFEKKMEIMVKRAEKERLRSRLKAGDRSSPPVGKQNLFEHELIEPRNVKLPLEHDEPPVPWRKPGHFLRPIHRSPTSQGPYVSPPRPPKPPASEVDGRPPTQFLNREVYKRGFRQILDADQSDSTYFPPLWKLLEKRVESQKTLKLEPAGRTDPPGKERVLSENTQAQNTAHRPPTDIRDLQPGPMLRPAHTGHESRPPHGPFMRGMSVEEHRAHLEKVRALNEERRIRKEMSNKSRQPVKPNPDYPKGTTDSITSNTNKGFGPFYAGKPVLLDVPRRHSGAGSAGSK